MSETLRLDGAKVRLLPFTERELTDTYVGWLNDPEVVRFSNQRFREHSVASCRTYLDSFADSANLFVAVRRRDTGTHIGTMTAYRQAHHGTVDVGIMIGDRDSWGDGFGQDAWDTLLAWLLSRDDIRKATAGALACNIGMVRLMERSGMELEGVRRAQEIVAGEPQDILLYAKFAP